MGDIRGFPLSYAVMCEFWGAKVFDLAEVKSLEYYLRLDADSTISCNENSPDAFVTLKSRRMHYGYYAFSRDDWEVSIDFAQHLHKFMAYQNASWAELNRKVPGSRDTSPMFYNNFEVVDLSFFRQKVVQVFTDSVVASNGIYDNR